MAARAPTPASAKLNPSALVESASARSWTAGFAGWSRGAGPPPSSRGITACAVGANAAAAKAMAVHLKNRLRQNLIRAPFRPP